MKKFFLLAATTLIVWGCSEKPGYRISGTVSKADLNGEYVYLYEYGNNLIPSDSAMVTNGSFVLKGVQNTPKLALLRFADDVVEPTRAALGENASYTAVFVLENGIITADLGDSPSVGGTPENDAWTALISNLKKIRSVKDQLLAQMKSEDGAVVVAASEKYDEMEEKAADAVKNYIQSNTDKLSAAKLLYDFRYSINEKDRRAAIAKANDLFKSAPGIDKLIEHLSILEKVAIGKKFIDIQLSDPDGKAVKLSDYAGKGKVVLVDFWASWCPPCRADMPHLVELYKQYKGKNFEIVGVSLDRTGDAWKKGIEELHITWPQMSDLKYWQCEGAALYGVNSIPHTVLIDKDGTILVKNLRGKELEKKLEEYVGN